MYTHLYKKVIFEEHLKYLGFKIALCDTVLGSNFPEKA